MTKRNLIVFYLFLATFSSCKKDNVDYNQKANEVIQQLILDESCNCILEIPKESMIDIRNFSDPRRDFRKEIVEKLHLRDKMELDSLEKLTVNFNLNSDFLIRNNIKTIPRKLLHETLKDTNVLNLCRSGILSVTKPIFNKEHTKAILSYGYAFQCIPSPMLTYELKNGRWKR